MIITRRSLIKKLIDDKVIKNNRLSTKFQHVLNHNPALAQLIVEHTSFLKYSAPMSVRIQCVIQNINEQPRCIECDTPTTMRTYRPNIYTFNKYCCKQCAAKSSIASKKRKQSLMEKYGVDNIFKLEEIRAKAKKTMVEKYGVEHAMQNKDVSNKMHDTMVERYGVEHAGLMEDFNDKVIETNIKKYGVEHAMLNEDVVEKKKNTMIEKYGVINPMHNQELLKKREMTFLEKYHCTTPLLNGDIRKMIDETNLQKYGVKYPLESPAVQEKAKSTMMEKYQTINNWDIPGFRERRIQASLDQYGVEYPIMNETIRNKIKETIQQRYEGKHFMQQHLSQETLNNLNDRGWLIEQHHTNKKTLEKIGDEIGVAASTVARYFKDNNVEILTQPRSQCERDITEFIKTLTTELIETNTRQVITPQELDIYFPERKLAIEINGIFWHGEAQGKDRTYHLEKTRLCNEKGIRLVHIWDFEWTNKNDVVRSRISSLLGYNEKIYARKCEIQPIKAITAQPFFVNSHVQGYIPAKVTYGLYHNTELVAAMSFGKPRYNKHHDWELLRYSTKRGCNVTGGASKLFKHFLRQHNPNSIITYSDKRWNTGNLYSQLEFRFDHSTSPNYYYFNPREQSKMWHRSHFQKHKLANKLEIFDPNLTEWENMKLNGYDRIWDCGNDVYVYDEKSSLKVNVVGTCD